MQTVWNTRCYNIIQVKLLSQAGDAIRRSEALEKNLTRAATPPVATTERRTRPRAPLILNRTTTTLDISHFPLRLKGGIATHFAAFCKPFGAGVELSINSTTTQYAGTGTLVPCGGRITVKGLRPNDTYMIAIAAYDVHGRLIGDLGKCLHPQSASTVCLLNCFFPIFVKSVTGISINCVPWSRQLDGYMHCREGVLMELF